MNQIRIECQTHDCSSVATGYDDLSVLVYDYILVQMPNKQLKSNRHTGISAGIPY